MVGAVRRERGERDAFGAELMQLANDRLGNQAQARAVVAHAVEALRRRDHAGERVGNPKAFLFQTVRSLTAERPSPNALRLAVPLLRGRPEERLALIGSEPDHLRRLRSYAGCIAKLTARDRKVLLLRRLHGLKTAQVAERTGLPGAMVEDRLASSLRRCWRSVRPPEYAQLDRKDPVLLAVSWYARLEGGVLNRGQLQELEHWLREQRRNARAFRIAESLWRDSALLQAAFNAEGQSNRRGGGFPQRIFPNLFRKKPA